jgi:hypothetical protein
MVFTGATALWTACLPWPACLSRLRRRQGAGRRRDPGEHRFVCRAHAIPRTPRSPGPPAPQKAALVPVASHSKDWLCRSNNLSGSSLQLRLTPMRLAGRPGATSYLIVCHTTRSAAIPVCLDPSQTADEPIIRACASPFRAPTESWPTFLAGGDSCTIFTGAVSRQQRRALRALRAKASSWLCSAGRGCPSTEPGTCQSPRGGTVSLSNGHDPACPQGGVMPPPAHWAGELLIPTQRFPLGRSGFRAAELRETPHRMSSPLTAPVGRGRTDSAPADAH